ncbi:hypothetical protein PPYR_10325 [Photinus pyralis]|uniref:t-SNARE coiled-coil homology domain-containing protein n=3 Tax=Photinus pyralis TaxID=7054 RepID=A0A5N4AG26_PHOPY|nr:hypothetical protein PPYR_10325 [Photinus pyralis]
MISSASNVEKQPFKIIEIPLTKFKDEVIPHHRQTFHNYKASIEKYISEQNSAEIQKELRQKSNVNNQLKGLIYELDALKNQVQDSQIDQFNKHATPLRNQIENLLKDYLDLELVARSKLKYYTDHSLEDDTENLTLQNCQLELEDDFIDLNDEERQLRRIEDLNRDIQDVHTIFENLQELVVEQKESVTEVERNIESAGVNVKEGLVNLIKAAKLKGASYVVAGTCIGTMVGGPIGSVAGFKIGAVTALGCGILGYLGGDFIKKKKLQRIQKTEMEMSQIEMENKADCDDEAGASCKKLL